MYPSAKELGFRRRPSFKARVFPATDRHAMVTTRHVTAVTLLTFQIPLVRLLAKQ